MPTTTRQGNRPSVTALQAGEVDVLARMTTITFQRDIQLGIEFPAPRSSSCKSSGVKSVKDSRATG